MVQFKKMYEYYNNLKDDPADKLDKRPSEAEHFYTIDLRIVNESAEKQ